jgi:protein-S-isoprenylcysteine O-methyltransferase Ste14
MTTTSGRPWQPEATDRRRLIAGSVLTLLAFVLCLFLPAGTWAWPRGWMFFSVIIAASIVFGLYLRRANPDVIAARVNRHEGPRAGTGGFWAC